MCVDIYFYTHKLTVPSLKHVVGVAPKADILKLFALARKVGTFVLTDKRADPESSISSGSYIRLAQLQTPGTPLFPSLKRLRIDHADASLDRLNLLITDSLRFLEVINIDESQHSVLLLFLFALAKECPHLTSITLSPAQKGWLIAPCLRFRHLRRLQLDGIVPGFYFKELVAIGQALPELETFILDAETNDYDPRVPTFPFEIDGACEFFISDPRAANGIQEPVGATMGVSPEGQEQTKTSDLGPSDDHTLQDGATSRPTSPTKDTPPLSKSTFWQLRKLHIVGCLELIRDLVSLCSGLEDTSLTLVRYDESPGPDTTADIFTSIIEEILSSTEDKRLTRLFIRQRCKVEDSSESGLSTLPPILPSRAVEKMLLHPTLEHLEISDWTLESTATCLSCLAPGPLRFKSKLTTLVLPVGTINAGIKLSELRYLALSCPDLVSLQSTIVLDLQNLPPYGFGRAADGALSHNLKTLSVGSQAGYDWSWSLRETLTTARHLFVLFPALQNIQTHQGQYESRWVNTRTLFLVCQTACLDNNARSSASVR